MADVKERPILFSAPMVRAILPPLEHKTMTRRGVVELLGFGRVTEFGRSDTCGYDWHFRDKAMRWHDIKHEQLLAACPYGQPGERLWVRETTKQGLHLKPFYSADDAPAPFIWWYSRKVCPGIHMPRFASRILLELVSVRVERLQEISVEDARAEGCRHPLQTDGVELVVTAGDYVADERTTFAILWQSINGAGSWAANPWVWVVEFRRVKP